MSFRDGPFNDLKVPLTWTAAVAVIVAIVVGVALLLSDRRETLQTAAYGAGRKVFDATDKPVAGMLSAPSHWGRMISEYVGDYLFAAAENQLSQTLKSIFALSEAYPDLKANQNFMHLQQELTDTEDKIQAARRFYNGNVRDFNTKRKVFPTNIFAGMLGFTKDKEFFELDEAAQAQAEQPVEVKF